MLVVVAVAVDLTEAPDLEGLAVVVREAHKVKLLLALEIRAVVVALQGTVEHHLQAMLAVAEW